MSEREPLIEINIKAVDIEKQKKLIAEAIAYLENALYNYKNEIPAEEIHTGNYKARTNWWTGVMGYFQVLTEVTHLVTDPNLIKQMYDLKKEVQDRILNDSRSRTKDIEIEKADWIIMKIIENLQHKLDELNKK